MSDLNIVDLGRFMAVPLRTRNFLHVLRVGRRIAEALDHLLPTLTQTQQAVLVTIVAFRMQGSMMPANLTLLEHMPQLVGVGGQELQAVIEQLVSAEVLCVASMVAGEAMDPSSIPKGRAAEAEVCFYWPALERLIIDAVENGNRPQLVTAAGQPLE